MRHLLIVGGGSIGERHLRCFLQTGRVRVSLCETRPEIRDRLNSRYAIESTLETFSEALQQPFDAAVICTPAQLHVPMALDLGKRGIAVLIEKPLSTSLDRIDQLIELFDGQSLPACVAYVYRHHPVLQRMKQAIDSGRFGTPVQLVMTGGQHFPLYRPAYREIYYTRHDTGGGAIQDALTHLLNAGEWLVGSISRLVADAEHCVLAGVEVEDTVHVIARHGNVLGSYSLNQHQPPNETSLTVVCERGAARFQAHRSRWLSCTKAGSDWHVEYETTLERDDLFIAQAHAFLDQLDGRCPAACSLTEAMQTLHVNLAALESVRHEQWITLPSGAAS